MPRRALAREERGRRGYLPVRALPVLPVLPAAGEYDGRVQEFLGMGAVLLPKAPGFHRAEPIHHLAEHLLREGEYAEVPCGFELLDPVAAVRDLPENPTSVRRLQPVPE